MNTLHQFTLEMAELQKQLDELGNAGPVIMARSLNRAGVSGRAAMTRAVAQDLGISSKAASKNLILDKATRSTPVVSLMISGKRIPLIEFGATANPVPSRGKGRGVSYRLGVRKRIPSAFIATMKSGHRGVFTGRRPARSRKGQPRQAPALPIHEKFGPSLPHVYEAKVGVFAAAAQESLVKNLTHEISFERSKQSGVD